MAENTFFKRKYTNEEAEECFAWFEEHLNDLPPSFKLSPSINFPNLRATLPAYIGKLRKQTITNASFSGQISILFMLRDRLSQLPELQD